MIDRETAMLLVLPNAALLATALLRRTAAWQHAAAFSAGSLVLTLIHGYWDVQVLGQMDQKFRHAPDVALETVLVGASVFSAFGGVLIAGSMLLWRRVMHRGSIPSGFLAASALAGGAGAIGLRILYSLLQSSGAYMPTAWAWMCGFPLIYSAALTRYTSIKNQ